MSFLRRYMIITVLLAAAILLVLVIPLEKRNPKPVFNNGSQAGPSQSVPPVRKAEKFAGDIADTAYDMLINYNLQKKDFNTARTLIKKADSIYSSNKMFDQLTRIRQLAFEADMQEGKLKDAIVSHRKFWEISDLLALVNTERNIANREAQFDVQLALQEEYNRQQMEFLQTKKKIQESELKHTRIRSYVLLAGSIIMIILLIIGLLAFRLKQKNNSLLEKQKMSMSMQNESLKKLADQQVNLINEKEWLVKEVHHRVKNNLGIIGRLLNIQADTLKDESAISAIKDSQNRVLAMSFVHERLYEVGPAPQIDLSTYVQELVNYLKDALAPVNPIQFDLRIAPLHIGIAQAVPIGLILNEAVTNAIKYAFPDGRQGSITIDLQEQQGSIYSLEIKDNGVGMPSSFDWTKSKSLGFTLMRTMAEQIAAGFIVNSNDGVKLILHFVPRREILDQE